jgi:hypothetical protein
LCIVLPIIGCSFFLFSLGHCIFCASSVYGFWLPIWYLQTFPVSTTMSDLFRISLCMNHQNINCQIFYIN